MRAYIAVLVLASAASATASVWVVDSTHAVWAGGHYNAVVIAALAVVAALAERGRVSLGGGFESSISHLPTVFAACLFGPLAAMIVGGVSYLYEFRGIRLKWAVFSCARALGGAAAGTAAAYAMHAQGHPHSLAALSTGIAAAMVAAALADLAFASLTHRLRRLGPLRALLATLAPPLALSMPLYGPLILALALAYERTSPFILALFFVPALAAQRLFALYQRQRQLTDEVVAWNQRLEEAHESFVNALVATLDARDRYTAGHSASVAVYARDIAQAMGLSEEEQLLAYRCGLVHDIGKVGIPTSILDKPGALTLAERREMERHPVIGEQILAKIEGNEHVARIVRHHHERLDGNGYPDRLTGDEIPLPSRILAVADSYNAMTSERPYRQAMPSRVARIRLAQAAGTQLDTDAIAAFERVLATADEDYRTATGGAFALAGHDAVEVRAEPVELDAVPLRLVANG